MVSREKREKILILGGQGLMGSWISRCLLEEGIDFCLLDHRPDNAILLQVLEPDDLPSLERVFGNLADPAAVGEIIRERGITRLIHLAGADEISSLRGGSRRNKREGKPRKERCGELQCTFEAVQASEGRVAMTVYAAGTGEREEIARRYFQDHGIPSIGIRPVEMYGVGRECGLLSELTRAIKAAVLIRSFTIPFTGTGKLAYVEDVASTFLAACLSTFRLALALEPRTEEIPLETFIRKLEEAVPGSAGRIEAGGDQIQGEVILEESTLEELPGSNDIPRTPLEEGIRRTVERFRRLAEEGRLRE